jgi:hypothetical protein
MSDTVTGAAPYFNAALTNTAAAVRAFPTRLYGLHLINPNASNVYVQFFDMAVGSVTVGTTPPAFSLLAPANGGIDTPWAFPINFNTALTIAATTTATGSGAPASNIVANLFTK